MQPAPVAPRRQGFTLLELLVVLAIVGMLIALVPTMYSKAKESAQYSSALRTLIGDMRRARQNAALRGLPAIFFVDLAQRKFGLAGYSSHVLPEPLQITATVGSEQLQQHGLATIEFSPDGGATGGSIDVLRPSGEGTRLRVDWLSGEVSQERLVR